MARYPQAILVSCEVPWDENEQLMEDLFRREVRMVLQHFNHLYVFGTAGEGYAVDTPRFQQIVRVFYEETRGDNIHPMVGVIGLSTANIVERIAFAHEVGFHTFQISMPCWGTLNNNEVMTFFKDVCGAFPDSQFLHYNLPRAQRVLEAPDYRRLIDAVPNLVATKNTGGGMARAAALMKEAAELQHFFGESNYPHGCLYGECSLLASFGPAAPRRAWQLFEAGRARDFATMFELQKMFHDLLMDVLGPRLSQGRIDGAYDKLLKRLGGLEEMPLRLLSPYQSFSEEEYQESKRIFDAKYAAWAQASNTV